MIHLGYKRFVEQKLEGIVSNNLFPTTYDFESIVQPIVFRNGEIYNNHFFELSKDGDNTVVLKMARFLRSEKYLAKDDETPRVYKMFQVC